jgi:MFS family permease
MLKEDIEQLSIVSKDFFIVFVLLFDALAWYYMTPIMIKNILSVLGITAYEGELVIWSAYSLAIIGSGIVGSILSKKTSRLHLLYVWTILGVITSLLPALLDNFTRMHVLIISVLFGISFGLGMPSCLAYFADSTLMERRGRTGGIILLITNMSAPLLAIVLSEFDLVVYSIILASWRAFGLTVFLLKPNETTVSETETKKNSSFMSVFRDKSFILYFVAWLMFCFIDRFEWPILSDFFNDFHQNLLFTTSPLIASFSALVAGQLSDWIGRKRMILYGFVALGIAYAIIGIAPEEPISPYFYLAINSIAIGTLWVNFLLILWGDLSQSGTREKYYVIGVAPFFLTDIVQLLSSQFVLKNIL